MCIFVLVDYESFGIFVLERFLLLSHILQQSILLNGVSDTVTETGSNHQFTDQGRHSPVPATSILVNRHVETC